MVSGKPTPVPGVSMFLDSEQFSTVVCLTPLISLDFIVENEQGEVLLGKRTNRPAQGYWFVPGGRVLKDETLDQAFARLTQAELGQGFCLRDAQFYGVWQHFYEDNFSGGDFSTHYVVLGFRLRVRSGELTLPNDQHDAYCWMKPATLIEDDHVHHNTRAYFNEALQDGALGL